MDTAFRDILLKSVIGGVMIALLLSLARFKMYILAGLLVSLPAVSLYTFWFIGQDQGAEAMRTSIHAAIFGAGPWVLYLLTAYLLAARLPTWAALLSGVAVYLFANSMVWILLRR